MKVFSYMEKYGYEQVVLCYDSVSGLRAVVAIHDTTLGPALGGCRMWTYASEDDAIVDALRLARAMTYKNAAAGLDFGGGKAVISGDPRKEKSEELFRAFGRFVETLAGRYITAEDVGTTVEDMDIVRVETSYVVGTSPAYGGSGDPSPGTALGVWKGMKACVREVYGSDILRGRAIALQGLGNVGSNLVRLLHEEGAKLVVTDIDAARVAQVVERYGVEAVEPEAIYDVACDIFSPNALGGVLNDETIPRLRCKIVAGAANNQLAEERHGDMLHERGILYAPDYVINAGGVIHVADEAYGFNRERAYARIGGIYGRIKQVIDISRQQNVPTYRAADIMAEERMEKIGRVKRTYVRGDR